MLKILYIMLNLATAQENQPANKTVAPCTKEPKCGSMLDLQRKLRERRDQKQQTKIPASPAQPQPVSQSRG
jgi:hypothetical protein